MTQPDRTNVTFHFDNVHICFGTQIIGEQSQSGKSMQERTKITPLFAPSIPMPGKTLPVRPSATSALGTICASVIYTGTFPDEVRAFVYPLEYYPASPPATPPSQAVTGTSSSLGSGVCWSWNSSNYVCGANYSAAGNQNQLAIWRRDGATWTFDGAVQFTGVTGTMGPCGSGSGSGSGSRSSVSSLDKNFPKTWSAAIRGFKGTVLASFNANWALHLVPKAPVPTWDNGGDDGGAVKVTLTLDKQSEWHLTLAVQQIRITYTLPLQGHAFGPLKFPERQENVAHVGLVALPAIEVLAM